MTITSIQASPRLVGRGFRVGAFGPDDVALLIVLMATAVFAPFAGGFYLYVMTLAGVYAIVAIGNNLLLSHAGLVSIGQGGLCAVGAYAYGIAAQHGLPIPICLIGGVAAATVSGILIGLPALRLSGHYLALVTLAFSVAVMELLIVLDPFTGGISGMSVATQVLEPLPNFYAVLTAVALTAVSQSLGISSRLGISLRLMRDSERAAASVGLNVAKYKLIAFAYSGALAGLAGGFFVSATSYLAPTMFDVWLSIYFLVAVVLGGMNRPAGAILGAAIVAVVPQLVSQYQGMSSIIFGAALLVSVLAFKAASWLRVKKMLGGVRG